MKKVVKCMLALGILATTTQILPMNIAKANQVDNRAGSVSTNYSFTVPIVSDSETSLLASSTDDNAANQVDYIEKGKLTSWVENSSGTNYSSKVTYSSTGYYRMAYHNNRPQKVKLNISTSTSTWGSVATNGKFLT